MFILDKVRQMFSESSIPVGNKLFSMDSSEFSNELKHDYKTISELGFDERIYSIVAAKASLVYKAYEGIALYPADEDVYTEMTDNEKKIKKIAVQFARDMKYYQLFFDYAWDVITFGDLFEKIVKDKTGISAIKSLPLNACKVIAIPKNILRSSKDPILEENMLFVRANTLNDDGKTYEKEDYVHLSFKNRAVWKDDIDKVKTYGIYSYSPLAPLQLLAGWKKKTIENDIIWKNKILPRILWTLKMPGIVPSKYTGTQEEKVNMAVKQAKEMAADFTNNTRALRPDSDIVVSDAVEGKVLEPNSTNYKEPNDTIGQINTMLNSTLGIPSGLLGGEVGAAMGMELAGIFASIRADYIASKIADVLTDLVRRHLRIVAATIDPTKEIINRIYVHTDPALSIEKFESVKTALSMGVLACFTKNEIRKQSGYPPLFKLDSSMFPEVEGETGKKMGDMLANINKEKPGAEENNNGPKSERNNMQT